MTSALRVLVGNKARISIQQHGLSPDDIKVLVGASGGPKWFVLAPLDGYLGGEYFRDRKTPLHLLGSSAGAFRFSCIAQNNAPAVTQRFLDGYTQLRYPDGASAQQITEISQQLLDHVFSENSVEQILSHPTMRLNVIAARAKHLNSSKQRAVQMLGLGLAASANAVHRRLLGGFFERTIFHHPKDKADFLSVTDLPTQTVALNKNNLIDAVMASGSIPMIMKGIKDIAGARPGNYRDGGITDYHFDLPFCQQGLVLYPHFSSKTSPGWFDKSLSWRKATPAHYENVIMLVPSEGFVANLPNGKIPDRKDFSTMDDQTRLRTWRTAIAESERLSDEFGNLIAKPAALVAALEPLN